MIILMNHFKKIAIFIFAASVFLSGESFAAPVPNKDISSKALPNKEKAKDPQDTVSMEAPPVDDSDPLEPMNRVIFGFNDILDTYLLRPVAYVYREIIPVPVQNSVRNVYHNIEAPIYIANAILQGDETRIQDSTGRFLVNSFFGVLGLFDVASEMEIGDPREDFGQTLAVWGVGSGPYIVLPLWGSSTLRDAPAMVVDYYGFNVASMTDENWPLYVEGAGLLDLRARNIARFDNMKETSIDYYAAVKSFYLQNRAADIRNETSN